jgi:tetratricopeptide (TPR) repeat protein
MRVTMVSLVIVWPLAAGAALPGLAAAERELQDGRIEPAIELFLDVLEDLPSATPDERQRMLRGLFSACAKAFEQGRLDSAAHGLIGMLGPTRDEPLGPDFSASVRAMLQEVAAGQMFFQRHRAAISALGALMEDSPGNAKRWALLVGAHLGAGDLDRAEEALRHGRELYPEDPDLLLARAQLTQAASYRAVERASYGAAESLLRQAEQDLAADAARKPNSSGIRLALGSLRTALLLFATLTGQSPEAGRWLLSAEEDLELAAYLDPHDPAPRKDLAQLLIVVGDWTEARRWLLDARCRVRSRLEQGREPVGVRLTLLGMEQEIERLLGGVDYGLVLEEINLARFDGAARLIERALEDNPAFAEQAERLRRLVAERRERLEREFERIRDLPAARDRAVEMGELWFRLQRFDEAARSYREALAAPAGGYSDGEIQARLAELDGGEKEMRRMRLVIGSLDARLTAAAGVDTEQFASVLEKAWALLAARLEQRPRGPLHLALFASRRDLLERMYPGRRSQIGFSGALGRVMLVADPRRNRREWTDELLAALTVRGVQEASFGHAPRWLEQGMAGWVAREWSDEREGRLRELARLGRVPLRLRDLELAFVEYWNEPEIVGILDLAAEHWVRWLVERFGAARLNVLLSVLRQRTTWEQALGGVFGVPGTTLENEWRASLEGPLYAPPSKRTK